MKPTASNMTAMTKWLQPAGRWRMPRMSSSSSVPMTPAMIPSAVPPPVSHNEARPQNASPVARYARSVATTASRKAMGKGTTMGWMGWRRMATAVWVPSGRGIPSFFMAASGRRERGAVHPGRQAACRSARKARSVAARVAAAMACLLLLGGCMRGPLSTLAPASEVTRSVAALWWSMAAGAGVVLLLMVVLAALALRQNPPRAPGSRGVRVLLIAGGLMLPSAVIAVLLVVGLRLDEAQWPPGVRAEARDAFHVDVIAHQWWWEVRYPGLQAEQPVMQAPPPVVPAHEAGLGANGDAPRTVNVLHVPAGVPIHLRIMASDVIHGFWVPRISGKLDAVPGRVNRLRLMVDEPGEYAGVCAEYCGDGHAHMPFTLIAHPPEEMDGVLAAVKKGGQ